MVDNNISDKSRLIPSSSNENDILNDLLKYTWSVKLDHEFPEKVNPFQIPRIKQAFEFVPLAMRYIKFLLKCKREKRVPPIDFFNPIKCQQIYGAPIGGIGCGTIGRSYSGDFCRYQLVPGIYEHETVEANMFTACIRRNGTTVYQQALSTKRPKSEGLKSWNMAYSGDHGKYYAYYPQSWTVYDLPGQNVKLTLNQLSPIIPHDYKDSTLPVALFNWTIDNNNETDIDFSLMFTWQSGSGSNRFELSDVKSEPFNISEYNTNSSGVLIHQKLKKMNLDYCVAALQTSDNFVTYSCQFYPNIEKSGQDLWMDLLNDGKLNNNKFDTKAVPSKTSKLAIAVCVQVNIKAKSSKNIDFSLVWNMPNINFKDESKIYKRIYTRYFEQNDTVSQRIACYGLSKFNEWKRKIIEWQTPYIRDPKLPEWYKRALFNELYFVSDGGTVWVDVKDDEKMHPYIREHGRFAYLEGHEYRMFNTYDVHFYASFALIKLWPNLQVTMQYDFAQEIPKENNELMQYLYDGNYNKLKTPNSVPHDLGDPENEPWITVNAYNSHDTKDWKDLNLKFILTVYRDYYFLKDKKYLEYMWPIVKDVVISIQKQDHDNDGLIDSEGRPDQTYDAWSVTGASAYCGGLHVAVLQCSIEMAKIMNDNEMLEKYNDIYKRAKIAYNEKLWNGSYYNYDSSNNHYKDSIMADMCCGHWYLRSSGFKYEAFDKEKIQSCLQKIYEYNIIKYGDAKLGAVNGMRPDGSIDVTSLQSEEMWTGVTDSIAALLIYEGMDDKAWNTINGLYELCYNRLGLAFQTPEALMKNNVFRSLGYMRALGIWAIQYALDDIKLGNN